MNGASTGVSFQEFNTEVQCKYVASILNKRIGISDAFCVHKGL
jgi:hypothetical protein